MLPASLCILRLNVPLYFSLWDVYVLHVTISTIPTSLPVFISSACSVPSSRPASRPVSTVLNVLPVALCSGMQFFLLSLLNRLQK